MAQIDSKTPKGSLSEKWTNHKSNIDLVSPANKRSIDIIVIGTGLAGASASATLAELGYNVKSSPLYNSFISFSINCFRFDHICSGRIT